MSERPRNLVALSATHRTAGLDERAAFTVPVGGAEVFNLVDSGGIGAISIAYTSGTGGSAGTDAITLTGIASTNIEWSVSVIVLAI